MGKSPRSTPGKRPPAASVTRRPKPDLKAKIAAELYTALERLDADEDLLAVVSSWRDTLSDEEVSWPDA
jgi:hypothetical protein